MSFLYSIYRIDDVVYSILFFIFIQTKNQPILWYNQYVEQLHCCFDISIIHSFGFSVNTNRGKGKNKWEQTLALIGTFAELPHSLAFAFGRLRILWESPTQISVENSAGSCQLMKKKKSCRLSKISAERMAKNEQHHHAAHHDFR